MCLLFPRGKLSISLSKIFSSFKRGIFFNLPFSGGFLFGAEILMSILDMLTFLRTFHFKHSDFCIDQSNKDTICFLLFIKERSSVRI